MPSRRSQVPRSDAPLFRQVAALRRRGVALVDLTVTNPSEVGLVDDSGATLEALADRRSLRYEPTPFGLAEARVAVAAEWGTRGVSVSAERVVMTASTSEAYAYCFKLLCDPGDEVLVPRPSYPLIDEIARYEGVRLVPYRVEYDGAWHVDVDSARRAVGPRTRAVIAVSPNNPTGSRLGADEVRGLAGLGVPLIVDEVFATYPVEAPGVTTSLAVADSPLIVLDGLSKTAALPQMKVAWMTLSGPEDFVLECRRRLEVMLDAFLSVGTPAQWALGTWLARAPATRAAIGERLRSNLAKLRSCFTGAPVTIPRVDAGWYAMLRLPAVMADDAWADRLLRDAHVLVHPGWLYDADRGPWLVVSLLTPPAELARGADSIERLVRSVVS